MQQKHYSPTLKISNLFLTLLNLRFYKFKEEAMDNTLLYRLYKVNPDTNEVSKTPEFKADMTIGIPKTMSNFYTIIPILEVINQNSSNNFQFKTPERLQIPFAYIKINNGNYECEWTGIMMGEDGTQTSYKCVWEIKKD